MSYIHPDEDEFMNYISDITNFDFSRLEDQVEADRNSFNVYKEDVSSLLFFINKFNGLDCSFIPNNTFKEINKILKNIYELLPFCTYINTASSNVNDKRIKDFKKYIDGVKLFMSQWLPLLIYKNKKIDEKIADLDSVKADVKNERNKCETILHHVQDLSGGAGVSLFYKDFESQSEENANQTEFWGEVLIIFFLITLLLSLLMLLYNPKKQ